MNIDFTISGTRLVVTASGAFDLSLSVNKFSSILSFCRMYSLDQVLIDFRDMDDKMFATAEIMYAHNISRLYQQHLEQGGEPVRIAYLGPDTYIRDSMPGLGIARAGGLEVLTTSDFPMALQWLEASGSFAS